NITSEDIPLVRRPPIPPTCTVQTNRISSSKNTRFPADSTGTLHLVTTECSRLSLG
ncbi:hypothetical protein KI387_009891, partial [Taxus chinensis]